MTQAQVYPQAAPHSHQGGLSRRPNTPLLQHHLDLSRGDTLYDRVQASFLDSTSAPGAEQVFGALRAGLYFQALESWCRREDWEIQGYLGITRFGPHETLGVRMGLLPVTGQEFLECLRNGSVFASRGEDRLIVGFEEEGTFPCPVRITLRSTCEVKPMWSSWREAVREDNSLQGRPIRPSGEVVEERDPPSWSNVFLAEDLEEAIRSPLRRFLSHSPTRLRELGIRRRGGMILAGPPGTGKTLLGRVLANSLGCTFIWTTPTDLCEAEAVREILDLARLLEPTVLFLEDLDILAEDRSRARGYFTLSLGELMNQLDGFEGDHAVFTIATTNRADVLEEAICNRPGRFDRVLEIPAASPAIARAFLDHRLAPHGLSPRDLDWLTEDHQGLTGAELEELANTVLALALDSAENEGQPLTLSRDLLRRALAERQPVFQEGIAGFAHNANAAFDH